MRAWRDSAHKIYKLNQLTLQVRPCYNTNKHYTQYIEALVQRAACIYMMYSLATACSSIATHSERLSLGEVSLPLGLRIVVHQEPRVQHEITIFECSMQGPLFH